MAKFNPLFLPSSKKVECNPALKSLFPLKAKERLLSPPMIPTPLKFFLIHSQAFKKFRPLYLSLSIPVPIVKIFKSNIISELLYPISFRIE